MGRSDIRISIYAQDYLKVAFFYTYAVYTSESCRRWPCRTATIIVTFSVTKEWLDQIRSAKVNFLFCLTARKRPNRAIGSRENAFPPTSPTEQNFFPQTSSIVWRSRNESESVVCAYILMALGGTRGASFCAFILNDQI